MNVDSQPDRSDDPPDVDSLGVVADAIARAGETLELAARHLDPSLVDVLRILGFDKQYTSAQGSYLYDAAGRAYLDFHTGEGFASLGHNHPDVREVLQATLAADLVDGVQIHYSALAGMLAEALSQRLPHGLDAVFFASTGAEAVDSAMKFARAATGRPRLLSCDEQLPRRHARPAVAGRRRVLQGGLRPAAARLRARPVRRPRRASRRELRAKDVAAFIVEPIQGRMVTLPPAGYLQGAQELCRRYGTLFVARRDPDRARAHRQVVRARALGARAGLRARRQGAQRRLHAGRRDGHDAARSTRRRGRHARALLRAPVDLRAQSPVDGGGAGDAARSSSAIGWSSTPRAWARVLLEGLTELQRRYEMIKEVRGSGLMIGIELCAPSSRVARLNWRLIHMASEGLFPQLIVIPLHRDHGVITMAAGKNDVIKLLPPLTLVRGRGAQLPRRARRRARRLPRRREQELGGRARHRHGDASAPRARRTHR